MTHRGESAYVAETINVYLTHRCYSSYLGPALVYMLHAIAVRMMINRCSTGCTVSQPNRIFTYRKFVLWVSWNGREWLGIKRDCLLKGNHLLQIMMHSLAKCLTTNIVLNLFLAVPFELCLVCVWGWADSILTSSSPFSLPPYSPTAEGVWVPQGSSWPQLQNQRRSSTPRIHQTTW